MTGYSGPLTLSDLAAPNLAEYTYDERPEAILQAVGGRLGEDVPARSRSRDTMMQQIMRRVAARRRQRY